MKIKKLYGENIYSFRKMQVDFADFAGVISIILGKSLDEKTANGAGKSSILKSLFWGLWNKELNGATIEEMINRMYPDDGMLVVLEFEDRGYDYKITRYKDYRPKAGSPKLHDGTPVSGSGVEFLVNGNPLMGDSHPKTQQIIEQKLKMTPRLFLSCVLMAQNTRTNFLTANDTEKKEILSELLDLQAYEKAFKAVKDSIKEVEDRIGNNENRIENLNEQITNNEEQIVKLTDDENNYVLDTQMKLAKMDMEVSALEVVIKKVKTLAISEDKAPLVRAQIAQTESQLKRLKEQLTQEGAVMGALSALESEFNQKQQAIKEAEQSVAEKQTQFSDLKTKAVNIVFQDFVSPQKDLNSKITSLKSEISNLETNQISLEQGYLANQKSLASKIQQTKQEITETQKHLKEAQDNALCPTCLRLFEAGDERLDKVVKVYTDKIHALMEELQAKEVELSDIKLKLESLSTVNGQLRDSRDLLDKLEVELQELKNKDQEYQLSQKDKLLWERQTVSLEEEIAKLQVTISTHQKSLKINAKKKEEVQKLFDDLQPLKTKQEELETVISGQRDELLKLEGLSVQITGAKRELDEKSQQLKELKTNREELAKKPNPYSNMKANLQKMVETFKERLAKHKQIALESQDELKYLNFWKTGFSPIGIRSFITDDVIELLNRKTQENLNDIFDGAISVLFDPESKNNKGVVSNKISTTFLHKGKETSVNLLSGGELQRAILATELALTEVAEARAGTKLNLRFLDEPFTGMDNNGQIKSLGLFARMARDKDGFFVISHDENFQHLCQKALFVVKQKEISYIVDKETFNKAEIESADISAGYEEGENLQLINPTPKKGGIDVAKALAKKKKQIEDQDD